MIRRISTAAVTAITLYAGFLIAPRFESAVAPPATEMRNVPWDNAHPDQIINRQLDRVCWKVHYRRARSVTTLRRSMTIISEDGSRTWDVPLDGRNGELFNNRNSRPTGWEGDTIFCTIFPDGFVSTQRFYIENYGQFRPPHGLWTIDQFFPLVEVPGLDESSK